MNFEHHRHPRVAYREKTGPVQTNMGDHLTVSDKIGLKITAAVGTMACAAIFACIAFVSLPASLQSGSVLVMVAWLAQTFLQLVLLSIIMVGQSVSGKAADKRAEQTYDDAEAILHEAMELQRHLQSQDEVLEGLIKKISNDA